jgi:4-amino-4-deoxy-L-arabinose transferase-like glycosyltransferase
LTDALRRHYGWFAVAILGLALFNLTYRLDREFVTEWDESLYAISAWEAVTRGSWIGTTFLGELDYYNSKPPLMVWLIALSFKAFGASLVSLRLTSAISAWLTVAVLQEWARRCFGPLVALFASLSLATMFGFAHVHSGRSAATDAPFTLVLVLIVVVLWAGRDQPWRRVWLGPLLAAAFMLRGMAVLMPLALILAVLVPASRRRSFAWAPAGWALLTFAAPVAAWGIARYRLDGWLFIQRLVMYDFVTRTIQPIEGHPGGLLFYLDVLQKDHYDWLVAAATALALFPLGRPAWRVVRVRWNGPDSVWPLLAAWAGVTLLIPTVMKTKVAWYLNTFYPVFALGVALALARAFTILALRPPGWRSVTMVAVFTVAFGIAEGKMLWYSWTRRDISLSEQSLVLGERQQLEGRRVFLKRGGSRATHFVAEALAGAKVVTIPDDEAFFRDSGGGDYLLTTMPCGRLQLETVGARSAQHLCRRPAEQPALRHGHGRSLRSRTKAPIAP